MSARKTFLLVEDDRFDAEFVENEFNQAPLHISLQAVRDGVEAMQYVEGQGEYADREKYPLPVVILLDLKMPRMDGFEFLTWLRSRSTDPHRFIPVVVMSSSPLPEDVARAYTLGANSYLIKPVNWEDFRDRIRALGIYWSAHVATPESISP
jgi:CheY-like chemotaxis protein